MTPTSELAQTRWAGIATAARVRRLAIEIRDGTTSHPYRVGGKERSGADWDGGAFDTLDQAMTVAESWVLDHPVPGPVALRSELQDHGRKLAVLVPRDLNRKGGDFRLYRQFRDRILPLAFDNLVDSVRLEALESGVRNLLVAWDKWHGLEELPDDVALAVATLSGLVPLEEAIGDETA